MAISAEQNAMKDRNSAENFTNLYVKCFPQHFSEEDLFELFSGCGPIQAVKVMTDPRGRKSGFVNFEKHDDAKACVEEMHRKDLRTRKEQKAAAKAEEAGEGKPIILDQDGHPEHLLFVGRAQSKAERAAMFESQYGGKGKGKSDGKGDAKGDGKGDGFSKGKGKGATPGPVSATGLYGNGTANGAAKPTAAQVQQPSREAIQASVAAAQQTAQTVAMAPSSRAARDVSSSAFFQQQQQPQQRQQLQFQMQWQQQQQRHVPYANGNGYSESEMDSYDPNGYYGSYANGYGANYAYNGNGYANYGNYGNDWSNYGSYGVARNYEL